MSRRFLPQLEKKQPGSPPQDAHSKRIFSNRLQGQTAWQRHQEYVARYLRVYERDGGKARLEALAAGNRNDWDVLRERHRFLRDDDEVPSSSSGGSSYEDEVARRYYSHLFKEYAVADLKHYKSGAIALRWRSEEDVIEGIGQFTCANTRCEDHQRRATTPRRNEVEASATTLTPYEVNFAYAEREEGEMVQKNALVKVVLCRRCARKLNYKREHERVREGSTSASRADRRLREDVKADQTAMVEVKEKDKRRHARPRPRSRSASPSRPRNER
ncbi:hypothetical protein FA10DRAFT_228848 [Acaromyces ingoldii]|uniref:Protein FRA10AC1 n=1 Tax=Acaromyces ingoldii TaxID=215250 RepID=A0A316YTG6_9BASI|nr:hypothetical protein FA10DRAFT_228848 [Acaromyces ingoldii]PWN92336.1 hypothetical protein FA10DRAFT_228848 [Acaromyces ingoldii]